MKNPDAIGSLISFWTACFVLIWIIASLIYGSFTKDDNDVLGVLFMLGPFIGIIAIISGIIGYRIGYERKKALIGITVGFILLVLSLYVYIEIYLFFTGMDGFGLD